MDLQTVIHLSTKRVQREVNYVDSDQWSDTP